MISNKFSSDNRVSQLEASALKSAYSLLEQGKAEKAVDALLPIVEGECSWRTQLLLACAYRKLGYLNKALLCISEIIGVEAATIESQKELSRIQEALSLQGETSNITYKETNIQKTTETISIKKNLNEEAYDLQNSIVGNGSRKHSADEQERQRRIEAEFFISPRMSKLFRLFPLACLPTQFQASSIHALLLPLPPLLLILYPIWPVLILAALICFIFPPTGDDTNTYWLIGFSTLAFVNFVIARLICRARIQDTVIFKFQDFGERIEIYQSCFYNKRKDILFPYEISDVIYEQSILLEWLGLAGFTLLTDRGAFQIRGIENNAILVEYTTDKFQFFLQNLEI